jgi:hypothetical protein
LRKIGSNTIEVKGSKGNELHLVFSTTRDEEPQQANPTNKFGLECCRKLQKGNVSDEFRVYFSRLLEEALSKSHGAILICAETPCLSNMDDLKDGIELSPKLDFFAAYRAYSSDNNAESILRLQSAEDLLSGILQSDGIVIFDTTACVVAYRVFYRPSHPETPGAPTPTGGARRRAFDGVRAMVGTSLVSALFRSQDGLTILAGGE